MIDTIKTLLNKTSELEDKINNLSSSQDKYSNLSNFVCFSKGLINLSFLNSNELLIAEFETTENVPLYFQNQVELNVPTSQNVKITLIIDDIAIFRTTRKLQAGYNQLTMMKSYIPLDSKQVKLYLKIVAEDNSVITIISDTLFVWGLHDVLNNLSYQAIETQNNFLLSFINNNMIYYSLIEKNETALNSEDFKFYGNAISYSFAYIEKLDKLIIFRVDINGNLFFKYFDENNEIFIDSNVTHISSSSNENNVAFSVIKDNKCYVYTLDEKGNISNPTHVNCFNVAIEKSFIYFNKFDNKYYLVMSDKNSSNYIVQSILETQTEHYYINANYSISIETYGDES